MSLAFGSRHSCDGSVGSDRASASPCAARDRPWVLVASVLGSSLAFIESSIVNLALPALQLDLGLGSVELQWIVNAYLLMLGSLLMIGGAAGDRIGLKSVYLAGLTL
ncbi:MAG: MFS transporter, partial [Pseudomonadota bacterium]